ncbi:hypothetical protein TNCV_3165421 [Trichonephila clavipes]|nr:hypothetical protein TNCV_3165421 [Trichonephila clavipes]
MGQLGPGPWPQWGPRLALNSALIRSWLELFQRSNFISVAFSEKLGICQLPICDDRCPCIGLDLPPYTIIQSKGGIRLSWGQGLLLGRGSGSGVTEDIRPPKALGSLCSPGEAAVRYASGPWASNSL